MKRPLLLGLALLAVLSGGCLHSKKNAQPKENPNLASETEEGFKQRWIEKRGSELVAKGVRADLARQQAIDEFRERFPYTSAAQK